MSLADLAKYFDVFDVSPEGWPVVCNLTVPNTAALDLWPDWPKAALPENGRAASGHGVDEQAAVISGLGEAVEIASLCRWGDEKAIVAAADDLPGEVWNAEWLAGFSSGQRANRDAWNAHLRGTDWVPAPQFVGELEWVQTKDLNDAPVWVPAEAVFLGQREVGDPKAQIIADTNGCAAGKSDRAARSAALLELIERDATGRWWYGCRARRQLDEDVLDDAGGHLLDACRAAGLEPRACDITSDVGVPVVAVAGRSNGGPLSFGFAAAPTYACAALKALIEMAQMALVFISGDGVSRPGLSTWTHEARFDIPPLSLCKAPTSITPPEPPPSIGVRLRDAGIRVSYLCQTRPEFKVPVWRALSPDLCHWKPRFGRRRLLAPDCSDLQATNNEPNPVLLRI